MNVTFVIPCIKTGAHLNDTLRSVFTAASQGNANITVHILTPLASKAFSNIPSDPVGKVSIDLVSVDPTTGMMGKFDHFLSIHEDRDPEEIFIFSNDDVIFSEDFIVRLLVTPLDDTIAGPVIRTPRGNWQASMFRKKFTFWRLVFRIHDGGLYSRFTSLPNTLEGVNDGRRTVDGCCFILNSRTLRRFDRSFNFVAFLYMEEVLFQYLYNRYVIRPKVIEKLEVVHLGGASLPHVWSRGRSLIVLNSVNAVSRTYLDHSPWQTRLLCAWFSFESYVRIVLGKFGKSRS